jgi:phospholipid-translocating ATPase
MKFVSQAYFPLDREIVREAWVAGDLKERLGVTHRRAKRKPDPEDASLFRPHVQMESDGSDDRGEYEPVAPRSAPRSPSPAGPALASQVQEGMTQFAPDMPSRYHDPSLPPVAYSANRAPPVSPPDLQPVPLSARSLTPAMAEQQGRHRYHNTSRSPSEYEMTNRSESALGSHNQERSVASRASRTTDASFVTASDGGWGEEEDDGATVRQQHTDNRSSYDHVQPGEAI